MSELLIATPDDVPGLLNRMQAERAMKASMEGAHDLLRVELDWGLRFLLRAFPNPPETQVADAAFRLFRLYLERLDAVDSLLEKGVVAPARTEFRSLLEIGCQLLYVLQNGDERVASAYMTASLVREWKACEGARKGSERRKEIEAEVRRTTWVDEQDVLPRIPDGGPHADRLLAILQQPPWKDAFEELKRLGFPSRWYRVFGGPSNFTELARAVGAEMAARAVYSPWSHETHGGDAPSFSALDGKKREIIRPLRHPEGWETIVNGADASPGRFSGRW